MCRSGVSRPRPLTRDKTGYGFEKDSHVCGGTRDTRGGRETPYSSRRIRESLYGTLPTERELFVGGEWTQYRLDPRGLVLTEQVADLKQVVTTSDWQKSLRRPTASEGISRLEPEVVAPVVWILRPTGMGRSEAYFDMNVPFDGETGGSPRFCSPSCPRFLLRSPCLVPSGALGRRNMSVSPPETGDLVLARPRRRSTIQGVIRSKNYKDKSHDLCIFHVSITNRVS